MKTKMTKEMIQKARELRKKGCGLSEIARKLGVSDTSIRYWVVKGYKEYRLKYMRKLYKEGKTWGHKYPEKLKEYSRKYQNERYKTDVEFRKKKKERNIRYQKAHPEKIRELRKRFRKNNPNYMREYMRKRRRLNETDL